jgi:MFS transporter, CP family, cyanate transporter
MVIFGCSDASPKGTATGRVWRGVVLAAVLVAGFNLRTAVTSLGALLEDVRAALLMDVATAGVLTALPVVCFAGLGALTPQAARRFGAHRMVAAGLVAIAVGLLGRSLAPGTGIFMAESLLALMGIAVVNVLLPPLVKEHFPNRIGLMTGLYSMSVAAGVSVPAAVSVPIGQITGHGWRGGLGIWGVLAAIAVVPWVVLALQNRVAPRTRPHPGPAPTGSRLRLVRSPTALALTVLFGMQSLNAFAIMGWLPAVYREAGLSADHAAALLGVTAALALPASLVIPIVAARHGPNRYILAATLATAAGYSGLLAAPAGAPLLWAALLGSAHCMYPLAITLISLRSRDPATATRLSGFVQGGGYLIAALGPFAVGALLDATGGWTAPLTVLLAALSVQLIAGLLAGRPGHVDGEMPPTASRRTDRRVAAA